MLDESVLFSVLPFPLPWVMGFLPHPRCLSLFVPCSTAAVHPKTGRVCVPIDPTRVREFDPFAVPTLGQLAREIDEYDREHGTEEVGCVSSCPLVLLSPCPMVPLVPLVTGVKRVVHTREAMVRGRGVCR